MKLLRLILCMSAFVLLISSAPSADAPAPQKSAKEALQAFHDLIGSWKATGIPEGSKAEKQKGFWQEKIMWEWQFKGSDVYLKADFANGKYFNEGQLRYLADKDLFQFTLQTNDKENLVFTGPKKENQLLLERQDDKKKEAQRVVLSLLHNNRYLYNYEVKPQGRTDFARLYQVGATKEGIPFAIGSGESGPECIVSGGLGTIKVTYKNQTYYVCCGGCRQAFRDEPEKYIKEFEEKKAKEAKEKAKGK